MANGKAVRTLHVNVKGNIASFSAQLDKFSKTLSRTGKKAEALGKAFTKGVAIPFAGIAAAATRATMEIDDALDSIRAAVGKAAYENKNLEQSFLNVFRGVPDDAQKVSKAVGDLSTKLKLAGKPLEALTTQVLNLSRITGQDLGSVIDASTKTFQQWNVAAQAQGSTLDYLYRVSSQTGISFSSLTGTLGSQGAVFKQLGFDLESSAALLGKLSQSGFDAEQITAGLGIALKNMAKSGVTDFNKVLTQSISLIQNARTPTEQTRLAIELFGKSGAKVAEAIKAGAFDIKDFTESLRTGSDSINSAAWETAGFSERLAIFRNNLIAAASPIEGALSDALDALKPVLEKVVEGVKFLSEKFASLSPETQAAIAGFTALAVVAGPIVIAFGALAASAAAFVGPATLVVGALAAIGYQAYRVYESFQKLDLRSDFEKLAAPFNVLADRLILGTQIIVDAFGKLGTAIREAISQVAENFSRGSAIIVETAGNLYEGVKTELVDRFQSIVSGISERIDAIKSKFEWLYDQVIGHSSVPDLRKGVESEMGQMGSSIVQTTGKAINSAVEFFEQLHKKGTTSAKKVKDEFKKIEGAGKSAAKESSRFGNEFKQAMRDIDIAVGKTDPKFQSLVKRLNELIRAGDSTGIKNIANEMFESAEGADAFNEALSRARNTAASIEEITSKISGSVSGLGDSLGLDSGTSGALGEIIGSAFTGAGSGEGSDLGKYIYEQLGPNGLDIGGSLGLEGVSSEEIAGIFGAVNTSISLIQRGLEDEVTTTADKINGAIQGAMAGYQIGGPIGAGIGGVLGFASSFLGDISNDTEHPETDARNRIKDFLNEKLSGQRFQDASGNFAPFSGIELGASNRFNNLDFPKAMEQYGSSGDTFVALGRALTDLLGITEDVGPQIGLILAENLSGNLDNARLLVDKLGLKLEDAQSALLKMAKEGQISWLEFEINIRGLEEAFKPGLVAVGDFIGAVDQLKKSGGQGQEALKALRDIAVEAQEAGVSNLEELKRRMLASGKFTADEIEKIFTALKQRGVTSLDALADVSDRLGGGVIADLDAMGFGFEKIAKEVDGAGEEIKKTGEEIGKLRDTLDDIPDVSEKKIKFVIETEYKGDKPPEGVSISGDSTTDTSAGETKSLTRKAAVASGEVAAIAPTAPASNSATSSSKTKAKVKELSERVKEEIAARRALENAIEQLTRMNVSAGDTDEKKFSEKRFAEFVKSADSAFRKLPGTMKSAFEAVSSGLAKMLNVSSAAAKNFASILAKNVGGSIDDLRHLVGSLNADFEEMQAVIVASARAGDISWAEAEKRLNALDEVFRPGLQAVGDINAAFQNLWASEGKGFEAIQSLRDLGIEALEAGATSLQDLKSRLQSLGKSESAISALMNALAGNGITSLDQLATMEDLLAGHVVADAQSGGFRFAPKRMARGGIVTQPMVLGGGLGLIGEKGPEAILPLDKVGGRLGVSANVSDSSSGGGVVIHYEIDARGADIGVENRIRQALQEVVPRAADLAVAKVYEMKKRGGAFAGAF